MSEPVRTTRCDMQGETTVRVARGFRRSARRATAAGAAAAVVVSLAPGSFAFARPKAGKTKSATVVQVVDRSPFGEMLATEKGASLYTDPSGPCTGSCLSVWPPLYMPKGKTAPLGVSGLGTVKLGHRLQVTYQGQALYTFASDSGTSVDGNGVNGFVVAAVAG